MKRSRDVIAAFMFNAVKPRYPAEFSFKRQGRLGLSFLAVKPTPEVDYDLRKFTPTTTQAPYHCYDYFHT